MVVSDDGDDADARSHQGERPAPSRSAGAPFSSVTKKSMGWAEPQHGLRDFLDVAEGAVVTDPSAPVREHSEQQFLRRRLADASGDADEDRLCGAQRASIGRSRAASRIRAIAKEVWRRHATASRTVNEGAACGGIHDDGRALSLSGLIGEAAPAPPARARAPRRQRSPDRWRRGSSRRMQSARTRRDWPSLPVAPRRLSRAETHRSETLPGSRRRRDVLRRHRSVSYAPKPSGMSRSSCTRMHCSGSNDMLSESGLRPAPMRFIATCDLDQADLSTAASCRARSRHPESSPRSTPATASASTTS